MWILKTELNRTSGGCGSFFAVSVVHSSFAGLSVVKQHQLVNKVLADDVKGWHGVQVRRAVSASF